VEAHPAPALAWSDGDQTIGLESLAGLVREARLLHRPCLEPADEADARYMLTLVESELERLLEARHRLSAAAARATA
jgi:hypothetical protein